MYIQGSYLGDLLSRTNGEIMKQSTSELEKEGVKAFNYRHLGSFAYVGDNKAVLQLPIIGKFIALNVPQSGRSIADSACCLNSGLHYHSIVLLC